MKFVHRAACILAALSSSFAAALATAAEPDSAQWQREDIQVFRDSFLAIDRSFSAEARKEVAVRLDALAQASEPLSPAAFAVELCRIAALSDNGHTRCLPHDVGVQVCQRYADLVSEQAVWCKLKEPDFKVPEFETLPIAFYPFAQDFHVVGTSAEHSNLLGARLVQVDGRAISQILPELRSFSGGMPAYRDLEAARVLSSPGELNAAGLTQRADAVTYELALASGRRVQRQFSLPNPPASAAEWQRLPALEKASWAQQERGQPFRFRDAPEARAIVVQLRQTLDNGEQKIVDFLLDAERRRKELGRDDVILDMRDNGGGNLLTIREFMNTWPTQVPGRFYVLTSRETFSAAIASIAYLKQAGADRVVIVGEPVGDRLMFFSDGLPVQLPRSGLFFLPAVIRMDFADGCRGYQDCFEGIAQPGGAAAPSLLILPPDTQRMPVAVGDLNPDVSAPWTIESQLNGTDPAMQAVIDLQKRAKLRRE